MRAVKIILTQTTMLCPADLVSRGNSSLGTSQPKGPQDLPYATTNMQIMTTRKMPIPFGSSSPSPNFKARVTATATCETNFQSSICYNESLVRKNFKAENYQNTYHFNSSFQKESSSSKLVNKSH